MSEISASPENKYPDEATYNKLVRDEIPAIIESDGLVAESRTLEGDELQQALMDKLMEEALELKSAAEAERVKEMSDVLEVLRSLADELQIDWNEIERTMEERAEKRGRFKRGIFLERTYRK